MGFLKVIKENNEWENIPVVLGGITAVLHLAPVLPGSIKVVALGVPDLLTPDDVVDVELLVVLLNPLSEGLTLLVICLYSERNVNPHIKGRKRGVNVRQP